jgi:hypothetical protein
MGCRNLVLKLFIILLCHFLFIPIKVVYGKTAKENYDYKLTLKLLSPYCSKPGDKITLGVRLINVSDSVKIVRPFEHNWFVDKESCTFTYGRAPIMNTSTCFEIQPGGFITKALNVNGLSRPVSAKTGYNVFSLPKKYSIVDKIEVKELSNIYGDKKIELKSNEVKIELIYPEDINAIYQQLTSKNLGDWKIEYIEINPNLTGLGFSFLFMNEKKIKKKYKPLEPRCETIVLFFIPKNVNVKKMYESNIKINDCQYFGYICDFGIWGFNVGNRDHFYRSLTDIIK